ncbi:nitrilase/cyanide hydratase and apolipoprotein N-acyltransferase [Aurantiacibacter atlanticus]|uniref:Nitrilase/cyanide hydratase and apolipoprotein N-acyltransferase n=1 Tax=Aurantiacibacter atlanticus TaxID=1648404 RepID=A0A0H4VGM8_9SPHN|nr:carbon-nitrogen hydrolase family protein [Aurantiacibacter atlanticus]AKQ42234.1 nitrilase/cyanide hydratase and apolipoprotein N-acyltransferase [Aurantiacibacter atlanticus]
MNSRRIALLQMTSGIVPESNGRTIIKAAAEAAQGGAKMLFTPEMSGLLDRNRERAQKSICKENDDPVLQEVRDAAAREGLMIALGSLAILREDGRWANRSFVIDQNGEIVARYDKIHMFDVELDTGESWRESAAYVPGNQVITVDTPLGRLGLAICYDMRFPALFEELGKHQCDAIAIPAAFTVPTGKAHWDLLLRARAVEASAYIIAAAQVGEHEDGRSTYGHSAVIDSWGENILDMGGTHPGVAFAEIDPFRTQHVRQQLPSLANKRDIPRSP